MIKPQNEGVQREGNGDAGYDNVFRELQQNKIMIKKLSLLSEASSVLLSELENMAIDAKFDFIVEKATEILDAELCTLWLVDNGHIYIKTSFGVKKGLGEPEKIDKQKRLPIKTGRGSGLHSHIAYIKKVHNLFGDALRKHPAITKSDTSDYLSTDISYSSLNYPMLDENNELLGLLSAYNKRDEKGKPFKDRGFSREFDEPLMKILTTKLIICINNSRLLNEFEKYKLIIETTPDPVVTTTLDGTMTYLNKGALEVFGDIHGEKVLEYYYSDDISSGEVKAFDVMRRLKESPTGSIKDYETVFIGKNEESIPVSASFSLLRDINGKVIGTIGIVKDLRKIKKLMEVGNSLIAIYDTDAILKKISEICLDFPKAIRAYAKIYDEKTNRLKLHALKSRIPGETFPEHSTSIDWGITGNVFKTQRPNFSNNLDRDVSKLSHSLFKDVNSKIVAPINRIDNATNSIKTFGVVVVDSQHNNAFSINDLYYLCTLANHAAAAIENSNLLTSKEKIITELSALKQVQETITRTLDIDQILESLVQAVVKKLGFDYATISKVDFAKREIGTVKGVNVSDEFLKMAWHPLDGNDIQAWVARNKEPVLLSEWDERLDREIYDRFGHQSLVRVYLPILSRDEAYGTLETGYKKEHRQTISDDEIEILKKIVNLAGIGIDQAYLLHEKQKLVEQLQALNIASVYIQSSRSENEIVNHIFRCLERIGYNQGMLSLINETTGFIEGRYSLGNNWHRIKAETKRDLKGNDILAMAIREKRPFFSPDSSTDPLCDQPAIRKANIKSQYVIPLIVDHQAIGTLQVDLSDKQGLVMGSKDILRRRMEVLETFASQIAIAIRNVRDRQMIGLLETTITETAHEFRSPLHNIVTQIGGLRSQLPSECEKSDEIKTIFKIITEEAHRAKRQMENTLLFTDRSRGLIGYNFETNSLQEVINTCVSNYRLRALERGIAIVVKDNIKKIPSFIFDRCKIEQVFNNLIDNAVKYSHSHRFIQIQGYDDGTNIHVDVWDKGLGIPESDYDNIFHGFARGAYKDKKRYIPGTGLGLKISKEIVEGHGGKIKVKSSPFFNDPRKVEEYDGYDTIFTVILPKKPMEK